MSNDHTIKRLRSIINDSVKEAKKIKKLETDISKQELDLYAKQHVLENYLECLPSKQLAAEEASRELDLLTQLEEIYATRRYVIKKESHYISEGEESSEDESDLSETSLSYSPEEFETIRYSIRKIKYQ